MPRQRGNHVDVGLAGGLGEPEGEGRGVWGRDTARVMAWSVLSVEEETGVRLGGAWQLL